MDSVPPIATRTGMPSADADMSPLGTWYCDGNPNEYEGGSWIGHMWPGFIMFMWGLHWYIGTMRNWYDSMDERDNMDGEPRHRSSSYLPMLWFPKRLPLEPYFKVFLPPIAISLELYFAHATGYRNLLCPPGSLRAGHFVGNHLNNWSHTALYPGFIISGIADLVSRRIPLPHGTPLVFLAVGFLEEALVMGMHKKHTALDMVIHQLLIFPMLCTSVFTALEAVYPHSLLVTFGRITTVMLQGTWLWAAARMLFEARVAWNDLDDTDLAPATYVPVLFVAHVLVICVSLCLGFVLYGVAYRYFRRRRANGAPSVLASSGSNGYRTNGGGEKMGLLHGSAQGGMDTYARIATRELPLSMYASKGTAVGGLVNGNGNGY